MKEKEREKPHEILIDTEKKKEREKIQHFHGKDTQQTRNRRKLPKHNKAIYEKSTANIL